MLLREIKNIFHKELDSIYGAEEVASFFYLLIEHHLKLERFTLSLEPNLIIAKNQETPLFDALSQLKLEKPIQHIIGHTHFMDMDFKVGPEVLIPRPETEELVRWILDDYRVNSLDLAQDKQNRNLKILDIGTGSGCIAVSLAKNLPNSKVCALDISTEALKIASENAKNNQMSVNFVHNDILDTSVSFMTEPQRKFDIIVSNPPYVRELEKKEMHANVLHHEPDIALFISDEDPLIFYRAIIQFSKEHLNENGIVYLEINQYLGKEMIALLQNNSFVNIELRKDMFGNDRMIKAKGGE